jgi:predicted metal-dependent phosphoesterase TrpH
VDSTINEVPLSVDLHCHSNISDGMLNPTELVKRAAAQGVTTLALTDHDTCDGLDEARLEANAQGMTLINGIEFSAVWSKQSIHVVGLGFDPHHPVMAQAIERQTEGRKIRATKIAQKLSQKGFTDTLEGALNIANGSQIGRPHFARYLVESGQVKDMATVFKKLLGAGKIGDVKAQWPDISEVVEWITAAGGIAVLAHPVHYKMTRTKFRCLLEAFIAAGGQSIEVSTGGQSADTIPAMIKWCKEYDLLMSQGSDFHHPENKWIELGRLPKLPDDMPKVWDQL